MRLLASVFLFMVLTMQTQAQVSLDELDAAMDARGDEMAVFRERLNDPDPNRAMTAMRLLIEKGDAQQKRMAIEHGLASTDPAIRMAAVTEIVEDQPILISRWIPEDEEVTNNFERRVSSFQGTIEVDNTARVPLGIGKYSEDEDCVLRKGAPDMFANCLFRINGGEVSFYIDQAWSKLDLDSAGRLVGSPIIGGVRTEVIIDLNN